MRCAVCSGDFDYSKLKKVRDKAVCIQCYATRQLARSGAPEVAGSRRSISKTQFQSETKSCPYCGEEVKAAATKCRCCGESLTSRRGFVSMMSVFGIFTMLVGGCLAGFFPFAYDISVSTDGGDVANLAKMNDRQVGTIIGVAILLVGVALFAIGEVTRPKVACAEPGKWD